VETANALRFFPYSGDALEANMCHVRKRRKIKL